jgi:hypothetical protein
MIRNAYRILVEKLIENFHFDGWEGNGRILHCVLNKEKPCNAIKQAECFCAVPASWLNKLYSLVAQSCAISLDFAHTSFLVIILFANIVFSDTGAVCCGLGSCPTLSTQTMVKPGRHDDWDCGEKTSLICGVDKLRLFWMQCIKMGDGWKHLRTLCNCVVSFGVLVTFGGKVASLQCTWLGQFLDTCHWYPGNGWAPVPA